MSQYFGHVVLFVRSFDACLAFYRDALEMKLVREYRGDRHPQWALLQRADFRLAVHAGHEGQPHKPVGSCVNFFVDDVDRAIERIERAGGSVLEPPEEVDFRPTQPVLARFGKFADPDGNEHYLVRQTKVLE